MFFSQDFRVFSLFFEFSAEKIPVLKAALGRFFPLLELPEVDSEYGKFGFFFKNGAFGAGFYPIFSVFSQLLANSLSKLETDWSHESGLASPSVH